jgi:hypothetical protein
LAISRVIPRKEDGIGDRLRDEKLGVALHPDVRPLALGPIDLKKWLRDVGD